MGAADVTGAGEVDSGEDIGVAAGVTSGEAAGAGAEAAGVGAALLSLVNGGIVFDCGDCAFAGGEKQKMTVAANTRSFVIRKVPGVFEESQSDVHTDKDATGGPAVNLLFCIRRNYWRKNCL